MTKQATLSLDEIAAISCIFDATVEDADGGQIGKMRVNMGVVCQPSEIQTQHDAATLVLKFFADKQPASGTVRLKSHLFEFAVPFPIKVRKKSANDDELIAYALTSNQTRF